MNPVQLSTLSLIILGLTPVSYAQVKAPNASTLVLENGGGSTGSGSEGNSQIILEFCKDAREVLAEYDNAGEKARLSSLRAAIESYQDGLKQILNSEQVEAKTTYFYWLAQHALNASESLSLTESREDIQLATLWHYYDLLQIDNESEKQLTLRSISWFKTNLINGTEPVTPKYSKGAFYKTLSAIVTQVIHFADSSHNETLLGDAQKLKDSVDQVLSNNELFLTPTPGHQTLEDHYFKQLVALEGKI